MSAPRSFNYPGSFSVRGLGASAFAAPWPRSGGCARASSARARRRAAAGQAFAPHFRLRRQHRGPEQFPSPKQLLAKGINVLPPEGRRGLQAAKTGNASSAAPAKIDRSIFIGACTDQRPESLRLLTIPSSRSLHGAAHAGNYQGRPKALGPPRAPSPSTRSPRWMERQEHLCALWLAWGAAAQGLNQGTDRLSMG